MTCDRCPVSLLCLGGHLPLDLVNYCRRCHNVFLHTSATTPVQVWRCDDQTPLRQAIDPDMKMQDCFLCNWQFDSDYSALPFSDLDWESGHVLLRSPRSIRYLDTGAKVHHNHRHPNLGAPQSWPRRS